MQHYARPYFWSNIDQCMNQPLVTFSENVDLFITCAVLHLRVFKEQGNAKAGLEKNTRSTFSCYANISVFSRKKSISKEMYDYMCTD